jgi:ADP-ribosylglycohydrolase
MMRDILSFPLYLWTLVISSHIAGGENVARGSLIGALLGAAHGMESFPSWSNKLHQREEIMEEIDSFISSTNTCSNVQPKL